MRRGKGWISRLSGAPSDGSCAFVLQVPPALNRFTKAVDKNMAETVFKLLLKYRPEDKAAKKARLLAEVHIHSLPPDQCCLAWQA